MDVVFDKVANVEVLLVNLNQPQAMEQVVIWREQVANGLREWSHIRFVHEYMTINQLFKQGNAQGAFEAAQNLLQQYHPAGEQSYSGADYDLATANYLLGCILQSSGASEKALPYLQEAQQRFETLGDRGKDMASTALSDQGNCLATLGQLSSAAAVYEECIKHYKKRADTNSLAYLMSELASVRRNQRRYNDALQGHQEALVLFQQLGNQSASARAWDEIGLTHKKAGDFEQAEQAYRQSMSISSQLGSKEGGAGTLAGLGKLYDAWNRPEQAITFYQHALDINVVLGHLLSEGNIRSNLACSLMKLQRYDEARLELLRAIECTQEFGNAASLGETWGTLHDLEQACGNSHAANEARQKAFYAYLAYRRNGGENQSPLGRLALTVRMAIQQGDTAEVEQLIEQLLGQEAWQELGGNFLQKLQTIITGERDLALAEDEDLHYSVAAELNILLESLAE